MERWFKNSQIPTGTAVLWSAWNRSPAWMHWGAPGWTTTEEFNMSPFRVWFWLPKNKAPACSPAQLPVPVTAGGVTSVRSHQQEICTVKGKWAASPCVGRGPAGTTLNPNFPPLFPEVMSCRKEFSFYRKFHKGTTQVLWFCLCIPKYTTFFLILYDLQLPYTNKLFAGEWGQAENLFIIQPL